jgi:hypothetical protein
VQIQMLHGFRYGVFGSGLICLSVTAKGGQHNRELRTANENRQA